MPKKRYTEGQIVFALKQAEGGTPAAEKGGLDDGELWLWVVRRMGKAHRPASLAQMVAKRGEGHRADMRKARPRLNATFD